MLTSVARSTDLGKGPMVDNPFEFLAKDIADVSKIKHKELKGYDNRSSYMKGVSGESSGLSLN
jgi:hypothetical protein